MESPPRARKGFGAAKPMATKGDPTDRVLMGRIQDGDTSALDEVLRRYWLPLVSYAQHLISDPDAAEDVVQEVVIRFWETRGSWVSSDRLAGFLYQARPGTPA